MKTRLILRAKSDGQYYGLRPTLYAREDMELVVIEVPVLAFVEVVPKIPFEELRKKGFPVPSGESSSPKKKPKARGKGKVQTSAEAASVDADDLSANLE